MRRNYWLSLSFANLVYLRAWTDFIPVRSGDLFARKALPGISLYFAVAGDVFALSCLTFLLIYLAPKMPGWVQRALPVAAIAMVALALRSVAAEHTSLLRSGLFRVVPPKVLFPLAAFFAAVTVGLAFRYFSLTLRLAGVVAASAIPCLAVNLVGALVYLRVQPPLAPDFPLAPRLTQSPPVRVLWILFDEWDQRLTFPNRATGTRLPILDSLANRSFTATRALAVEAGIPVERMATENALPSLLYGKRLVRSVIEGAGTRRLHFADGASAVFGRGSIFEAARSDGWNSAVAGWYLPYCRAFAAQVTDCYWDGRYEQTSSASHAVLAAAVDETRMLFETSMFSAFGLSLVAERHSAEYEALMAAARRYTADPSIGLAFIHFNIPHTPYFYSRNTGRFRRYGYSAALYDDALELVDRSLGDILCSLNAGGLDSKTAIILSSDHPARFPTRIDGGQDPHVPFIVHLPGQTTGVISTQEFSTIRTADLALAIAAGEVKSPPDLEHFLAASSASK